MRTITFKNVSPAVKTYPYVVFTTANHDFMTKWYWGAFSNRNDANEAALEVGGEMWVYGDNLLDEFIEWA